MSTSAKKRKREKNKNYIEKKCINCFNTIDKEKDGRNIFCTHSCAATYNNKQRSKEVYIKSRNTLSSTLDKKKILKTNIFIENCIICKKTFTHKTKRQSCSEKCLKLLLQEKSKNSGGYREGSGRGKSGYYKGYRCDSSWELAYIIYNIEHNISFTRNTEKFQYVYNNRQYYYIPDFVENNIFIEIKGYNTKQWRAKLKYFKKPIKVYYKKEINKYLDYVKAKYGKKFTKLYTKQ